MKPRVLAVDDDPEFSELVRYQLQLQGCEVLMAANAIEGLYLARTHLPDVILLDLMLPDLDGFSVCQILQTQPSTRNIPVFIVSALNEPWSGQRGCKGRFSKYFKKPVDLRLLGQTVHATWEENNELRKAFMEEKADQSNLPRRRRG